MLVTKFQIPAGPPLPEEEQGLLGPSAELVDFKPELVLPSDVMGRQVEEILTYAGTYGMGGPGFFGIRLGEEWLIISIWGAGEWLQVDGRRVMDTHHERNGSPVPWISSNADELSPLLVGRPLIGIDVGKKSMKIEFEGGKSLCVDEDSASRPILEGTKQARILKESDDLRNAVFISPTAELWV